MTRTTFAAVLPLLALLALTLPGRAVAGPPAGVSGRMVLDEVADGLRKYRKAADPQQRIKWLMKLAPTRDPRVAVALGEAWEDTNGGRGMALLGAILRYYCPHSKDLQVLDFEFQGRTADKWWRENKADLRRRSAQLPQ